MSAVLLSGCVSTGEYEAEKAKALNFQRLLAQEEQRTDELDARLQEVQQEVASLGSQNRELTAERDALKDQVSQQQARVQDGNASDSASDVDLSPDMSFSDPALSEFELSDFSFDESEFNDLGVEKPTPAVWRWGDPISPAWAHRPITRLARKKTARRKPSITFRAPMV